MKKKYVFSLDNGRNWSTEHYKTKESAINATKTELKSFFKKYGTFNILIGEYNRYEEDCDYLGEIVADTLNDRAKSKLNEYTEDYMKLSEEELKILNERIKNNIVLKDIDVNGTEDLLKIFRGTDIKIISIFLNISKEEMLRRLENRDDKLKQEEIELRMERYDYEMNHIGIYDYVIKNYDAEKTSNIILDIIKREQEQ